MSLRLVTVTLVMCMALIHASAFMHLTNAGLGKADWPFTYGVIVVGKEGGAEAGSGQTAATAIAPAGMADRIHRLVANILQLLIAAVAFSAFRHRKKSSLRHPLFIPMIALALSLVLAFLGAWFGSPLRYPWIMIVNLTGGIALFALFWWLMLELRPEKPTPSKSAHRLWPWAVTGLVVAGVQVLLGAWTDAYYAAFACRGLPGCSGVDWTWMDLLRGLGLLGYLQVNAVGRVVIDPAVAAAIHMLHRLWGMVAFVFLGWLGWRALGVAGRVHLAGTVMLVTLLVQVGLGLAIVSLGMPLTFVVAHTVVAPLLVVSVLTLIHAATDGSGR